MKTDFEIQKDVMDELQWEPALHSNEIGVSVTKGVVVLSGIVDSYYKKVLAEKAARKVAGVKAVAEEMDVKVPGSIKITDVDIAEAVLNALKWNSAVDETKIKIKVEKGAVTLEGELEWNFQKISAQKAIEHLLGVCEVTNNLRVKNRVTTNDIKQKIALAFLRQASLDSDKIKIDVNGDKVTLSGTVRSWAEKKDAERTVWSSPGVMWVDNKLVIDSEIAVY